MRLRELWLALACVAGFERGLFWLFRVLEVGIARTKVTLNK